MLLSVSVPSSPTAGMRHGGGAVGIQGDVVLVQRPGEHRSIDIGNAVAVGSVSGPLPAWCCS